MKFNTFCLRLRSYSRII